MSKKSSSFRQNVHRISKDINDAGTSFDDDFFSFHKAVQQAKISKRRETSFEKVNNPDKTMGTQPSCEGLEPFIRQKEIIRQEQPIRPRRKRKEPSSFRQNSISIHEDISYISPRLDSDFFPVNKIIQPANISEMKETSVEKTNNPLIDICPFEDVLYTFYKDKILTDIALQTSSDLFHVHKLVLCCRSAVFSAMLTEDLNAKSSNYVDIVDIAEDADTLRRLLLYIYTNEVQEMQWKNAADLLKAADKYELLDLKEKCSVVLKSKISRDNFCGVLSFADIHHETDLLDAVLDFISQIPDIFSSEAWRLFKRENPEIALNTTERIINNFLSSN